MSKNTINKVLFPFPVESLNTQRKKNMLPVIITPSQLDVLVQTLPSEQSDRARPDTRTTARRQLLSVSIHNSHPDISNTF